MKKIIIAILTGVFILTGTTYHKGAVALVNKKTPPKKTVQSAKPNRGGFAVTVRIRRDRQAIIVVFHNANRTSTISYVLSYLASGNQEGAAGTITPSGQRTITRELLFGTCSSGVCRYHTDITNATFEVNATLINGRQVTRRYRLRI